MIKHLLTIIWNQRRANGWIFAELLIVAGILWFMVDAFYVDYCTYHSPLGYDISNTWRFKLNKLTEKAPGYVSDSLTHANDADDLTLMMQRIRQNPKVEDVCASFFSCPYSNGNMWRPISPIDGDTTLTHGKGYQLRSVTPEYFRMFRIRTADGKSAYNQVAGVHNALVISKEMAEALYHGQKVSGRKVKYADYDNLFTIAAVASSIRNSEYERPEMCFYQCLDGELYAETVNDYSAQRAELCVRMKKTYTDDDMDHFLEEMGDRLIVHNLYVSGVRSIADSRSMQLQYKMNEAENKIALMVFMLVNVFFGIIGTFWLRMQNRRGEVGLRMAMGASRITLKRYMFVEGLSLLVITLPLIVILALNLWKVDLIDTYRMPYSLMRFAVTFGITYLLMGAMICIGIWLPMRKSVKLTPTEALHYE
jgi:hypothetical protein